MQNRRSFMGQLVAVFAFLSHPWSWKWLTPSTADWHIYTAFDGCKYFPVYPLGKNVFYLVRFREPDTLHCIPIWQHGEAYMVRDDSVAYKHLIDGQCKQAIERGKFLTVSADGGDMGLPEMLDA